LFVTDRILLTIPTDPRFRGVATLVLGGIGSRANLPYERTDDLQLAALSALEATDGNKVTLDVKANQSGLSLAIGPVRAGSADDDGLRRVLVGLVDEVDHEIRDGVEWLTLRVTSSASAGV
jgi:hypothetical protein